MTANSLSLAGSTWGFFYKREPEDVPSIALTEKCMLKKCPEVPEKLGKRWLRPYRRHD